MHLKEEREAILSMVKKDNEKTRLVIVPERRTLPRGTLHAILDQAGLGKTEFLKLLKE